MPEVAAEENIGTFTVFYAFGKLCSKLHISVNSLVISHLSSLRNPVQIPYGFSHCYNLVLAIAFILFIDLLRNVFFWYFCLRQLLQLFQRKKCSTVSKPQWFSVMNGRLSSLSASLGSFQLSMNPSYSPSFFCFSCSQTKRLMVSFNICSKLYWKTFLAVLLWFYI